MSETPTGDGPFPLSQVLADEYAAVHGNAITLSANLPEPQRLSDLYRQVHDLPEGRTALSISGGGIRSATFGLGVLQGLAQRGMLEKFDYLSTVSGGGYIGSWLTAWIKNHPDGLAGVSKELAATPSHPLTTEPEPVNWLRRYSNYLSPKLGLASADSWTLVGTYLRNLLLNWLVLIPLLLAVVAVPRLYVSLARLTVPKTALFTCLAVGVLLMLISLTYIHLFRPSLAKYRPDSPEQPEEEQKRRRHFDDQNWFLGLCLTPMLLASLLLTLVWAWVNNGSLGVNEQAALHLAFLHGPLLFASLTAVGHLFAWLVSYAWLGRWSEGLHRLLWEAVVILFSGALGGLLAYIGLTTETPYGSITDSPRFYACLAPATFVGAFLLAATMFVGLVSSWTKDEDREWWGRSGSWMLIIILGWSGFGLLVTYGPSWLEQFPFSGLSSGGVVGLLASWLGFSSRTAPETGQGNKTSQQSLLAAVPLSILAPIAALFVFVAGSALMSWIFTLLPAHYDPWAAWNLDDRALHIADSPAPWGHREVLYYSVWWGVLSWIVAMTLASIGFSWCININKFSLHSMYRNRLIRAYLGASRLKQYGNTRHPDRFTGFDPADNFQLTEVASVPQMKKPFHIVNVALNLVHGDNLAWQQRKAQSMTLSSLHCGSFASNLGYRRSSRYGMNHGIGRRAITLGTALAISGAAASPNMGYHSSPAVTFLLTLFNIRLGWWLGNPGKAGARTFDQASPRPAVFRLVQEALGLTDARNPYVYLSDGGHFENLGLYEMVLRRCHYIVVSDAGCDEQSTFQDLGNAIRKIRIDLGIDIDIDLSPLRPDTRRRVRRHYAIGTIHYERVDSVAPKGILIYLKPSLTGHESADVIEYASQHRAFPHEPTSDQFFDESQFESYRRLGEEITLKVFDGNAAGEHTSLQQTFHALDDREYAQNT